MTGHTPDKAERPIPHPFDYVTRDQIQDLWGIGYTIVRRSRHPDPFNVPVEMVPQGRSYQWWHLVQDKALYEYTGWAAVPASRHDGYFMPFGHVGPIEVGGLGLFEKPRYGVEQERAAQIAAVKKQTDDWAKDLAADGLSGSFSIGGARTNIGALGDAVFDVTKSSTINGKTKTIETTSSVPMDMFPHMNAVFAERDRLYAGLQEKWDNGAPYLGWEQEVCRKYDAALKEDSGILKGPTFNALLLPIAVENVRAKLKEGKTDE